VGKLRNNINDPNSANRSSQFGQWCYPDKPKIMKLLNNSGNFPRVSVESMTFTTDSDIGMMCTEQVENMNLKITIWSVRDLICDITSTTAEVHTYTTGTDEYELTNLPTSNIYIHERNGLSTC
jgi:hypothetical protein